MNLRLDREPKWEFTIPSAYDGTKLQCRIYHPSEAAAANVGGYKAAIVAHPYAPLGGSYDDHVVAAITIVLLTHGFYVATFNFRYASCLSCNPALLNSPAHRKAGILKGNTSLSGNPEVHDYASVVACLTTYLQAVKKYKAGGFVAEPEPMSIILAGYSYGSLIASRLPAAQTIGDFFAALKVPPSSGKHLDSIATQGRLHAHRFFHGEAEENPNLGDPADQEDILIRPFYLLVSPLLGSVVYFVTPTSKAKLGNETEDSPLVKNPTLALYGDADTFTSAESLTQWCQKLMEMPNSKFKSRGFKDVDHFWYMTGGVQLLQHEIREWLQKTVLLKT